MALFQLVYMSSLVMNEPEVLSDILDSSVSNNKRSDITGMMLYSDGNVLQILEGNRNSVLETFKSIQLDMRHRGIFVLLEEEITSRRFASWSMGFKQLTKAELEKFPVAANVFKVQANEIALRVQPSQALIVLNSFADGSMGIV
jgi:hypothetical protein